MSYKILEHTADARIYVDGKDLAELFESAVAGMMEIFKPKEVDEEKSSERILFIESDNPTFLLIDFLNEVLLLVNKYKETYSIKEFKKINDNSLEAVLSGNKAGYFGRDIKAATYHEADIRKNDKGLLETNIVFDI
jgi:SHS2 domain-containing protein